MTFRKDAEAAAIAWKAATPLLPDEARAAGSVRGKGSYEYCLPSEFAGLNLLPEATEAIGWFEAAGIPWHDSVAGGPTNHLLSSQVQCVNALAPMADDAAAIRWFFDGSLDIAEVLPVGTPEAPEAFVAFEWIGADNPLGEWRTGTGTRGSMNTSADAAIRYRNSVGGEELALIEWKYVETYHSSTYDDEHLDLRLSRYRRLLDEAGCPIRSDVDHADLICEPIYQLMRLQLLAWRTELLGESLSAVRVVVCAPRENDGYHGALPGRLRESAPSPAFEATNIGAIWRGMLTAPDRFAVIDTGRLVEIDSPTSVEFKARYGHLRSGQERSVDRVGTFGQGSRPVSALIVLHNESGGSLVDATWTISTVLHQAWPLPIEVMAPWSAPISMAKEEALEAQWRYLAERVRDHGGGNGYSYEVVGVECESVEVLREHVRSIADGLASTGAGNAGQLSREPGSVDGHQRSEVAADRLLDTSTDRAPWEPSRHLLEVTSWRVVEALLSRHPRLLLIETHPGGGQYDCLTLFDRGNPTSDESISLNRVGSAHMWRFNHRGESAGSQNPDSWSSFWSEWLGAEEIERVLLELERRSGLGNPAVGPPSVAARCVDFIATALALTLFSGVQWECRNGMEDTSGCGGGPRDHYFALFPEAESRRAVRVPGDLNGVPEYRFWFLLRDGRPVACVETTGTAWTVDDRRADLEALDLLGGTVAAAVADLMAGWLVVG